MTYSNPSAMLLASMVLGLGVFSLVNFLKILIPSRAHPHTKMLLVFILAVPGASLFGMAENSMHGGVLVFLGTIGAAPMFHVIHRYLRAAGDAKMVDTLNTRARR